MSAFLFLFLFLFVYVEVLNYIPLVTIRQVIIEIRKDRVLTEGVWEMSFKATYTIALSVVFNTMITLLKLRSAANLSHNLNLGKIAD